MGIQLGIVGYGGMGGFHHRNASKIEGVQVVGAYDIDPVRVQVAEESGLRGFSSLEDLLACEDINTVLVAVPNDCHMEICIAASNAGKHVICEKPAALNVDELDQMIAAAGRKLVATGNSSPYIRTAVGTRTSGSLRISLIPGNWERCIPSSPDCMDPVE